MNIWSLNAFTKVETLFDKPSPDRTQELLIICHADDAQGLGVMENVCKGFEFLKIQFTVLDISQHTAWPSFDQFSSVVICTDEISRLPEDKADRLKDYVSGGGGLFVPYRCWHDLLADLFALSNVTAPKVHDTTGISFKEEVFPGLSGLSLNDENWVIEHNRFNIREDDLSAHCQIFVTDFDGRPLAWRHDFGAGKVVYWNTTTLFSRIFRGIVVQTALASMQVGVGAVAGFAMLQVDDFPPAMSDASPEPIATEFPQMSWNSFLFDTWHADMMKLREKHDLKFSFYAVMNYHDQETSSDADLESQNVSSGRPVLEERFKKAPALADGDEYGFHGYNHEPLISENWPDLRVLEHKLKLAREHWIKSVPAPLPTSWVPAHNWYHPEHVQLVKKVFPEIKVVCSLRSTGDHNLGEYREFGPEPWEPSLTCLPRETFGYVQRTETRLMMLSEIASTGVWTHFIHPDDIYDIPETGSDVTNYCRNPQTLFWKATDEKGQIGLYHQFDAWLGEVRTRFPWLTFVTTSDAEQKYQEHIQNQVEIRTDEKSVEITTETAGEFYLRTDPDMTVIPGNGGEILDQQPVMDGCLNIVRCKAGKTLFKLQKS